MAGLIAAEINNNIGIAGVAQSDPARSLSRGPGRSSDFEATVADGVLYLLHCGRSFDNQRQLEDIPTPEDAGRWRTLSARQTTPEFCLYA
jgi:hypothetical protein